MKYDFAAVDIHHATLGAIIANMESNYQNMVTLKSQLLSDFTGSGATGYQTVMDALGRKLDEYHTSMQSVKGAIAQTASSQGLMKVTDVNNGNRFYAIGG
ncbi:WXG100 family type VII secretion target [Nocardia sp. NBC_00511]|uniref:WXG100 family type VII secretion target n=1 Tax=Nocardia sp. NBC_00511 TaxID=2903591 RepID=UPI002F90CD21